MPYVLPPREPVRAAVLGHLVGDAIGVPYEFTRPEQIDRIEFRGHGTHNQPPGTWSDDGALMLALLDSLLTSSIGFDIADQAKRFLRWLERGEYTPDPGRKPFDVGNATRAALARVRRGIPPEEAGADPDALGNGSLMRILPIALAEPGAAPSELVEWAHRSSQITHGAPVCLAACALYVLIGRELLQGERDRVAALERAIVGLRVDYERRAKSPRLTEAFDELLARRERVGHGRGHVLDTLWSAWEAFVGAGSYRSAIESAVRYGGDTDTTAAVAGGLAGLYWGLDPADGGIPAEWHEGLRGRRALEPILTRLDRHVGTDETPPYLPPDDPAYPFSGEVADASTRMGAWVRRWERRNAASAENCKPS
jgi:ADP-ribosyl-[dinitrogen reductase] hydrolase